MDVDGAHDWWDPRGGESILQAGHLEQIEAQEVYEQEQK